MTIGVYSYRAVLLCVMLAGCYAPSPDGNAVKAAIDACEKQGGTIYYFHGGTVRMECHQRVKP